MPAEDAIGIVIEPRRLRERGCLSGVAHLHLGEDRLLLGVEGFGVLGDVGRIDPFGARLADQLVAIGGGRLVDESLCFGGGGLRGGLSSGGRGQRGGQRAERDGSEFHERLSEGRLIGFGCYRPNLCRG
jgi:hypothetical protein